MKLSLVQLTVGPNLDLNLKKLQDLLNESIKFNPDLILLPECCLFLSNKNKHFFSINDSCIAYFKNFAKLNNVYLLVGSLPIMDNGRPYNQSLLIDSQGTIVSKYNKIHMFDVMLKNGENYRESEYYTSGNDLIISDIQGFKVGHTICYDLRFPKLYRALAKMGSQIIVVPSAFTQTTGKAHWHTLVRARAIENGVFILAPNQWGTNEENRSTYGHSMVVNPWGDIIAEAGNQEMVLNCQIDLNEVELYQQSIPVLSHDRNFEY